MKNILFICYGNVCRSPTAELLFNDLVERRGLGDAFFSESAATCDDNVFPDGSGRAIHPSSRRLLEERGIDCSKKQARLLTRADYDKYDLLLYMDKKNRRDIAEIMGEDREGKIKPLSSYTDGAEIDDPWFTGDYKKAIEQIEAGVTALLDNLSKE